MWASENSICVAGCLFQLELIALSPVLPSRDSRYVCYRSQTEPEVCNSCDFRWIAMTWTSYLRPHFRWLASVWNR